MFAATATATATATAGSGAAVAATRCGSHGSRLSGRAARAPANSAVRRPVRCQAVNGSQHQEKRERSNNIMRNGGSAAPTPPATPPATPQSPPFSSTTTSFSDGLANNISFNKPDSAEENTRTALKPAERSRDVLMRAREIMSVDPSAPSALNLIGSKVDMKVEFRVHYDTKLGEDLYVIGSHEKLGAWDQTNAVAMTWSEGGNWSVTVDLPAGG